MVTQAAEPEPADPVSSRANRYSDLFQSAGEAMLVIGDVLLDCNDRALELFRATPGQFLGQPPDNFFPPTQPDGRDSRKAALEYSQRAARGEIVRYKWRFRRPDQSTFQSSVTLNEISTGGESLRLAIVCEDTPAAELESQLESANAELESLTWSVSHDVRAALSGIAACSRIVLEEHNGQLDDAGKRWLGHIRADSIKLDQFTASLLDLSRISRAGLRPTTIDISSMALEIGRRLAEAAPHRTVDFVVPAGLSVQGDSGLVRTLIEKLIENAWKFTAKTAAARVEFGSLESGGAGPVFFVRDNGIGFDMAHADKLFVPFQRLHSDPDFEGAGMGLATVRRIVHRHRGKAWAEGAPGKGAIFFFTLPGIVTSPGFAAA